MCRASREEPRAATTARYSSLQPAGGHELQWVGCPQPRGGTAPDRRRPRAQPRQSRNVFPHGRLYPCRRSLEPDCYDPHGCLCRGYHVAPSGKAPDRILCTPRAAFSAFIPTAVPLAAPGFDHYATCTVRPNISWCSWGLSMASRLCSHLNSAASLDRWYRSLCTLMPITRSGLLLAMYSLTLSLISMQLKFHCSPVVSSEDSL